MRSHLRRPASRDARRTVAGPSLNAQRSHGREAANAPLPQQRLGNRAMQRMLYSSVGDPGGGASENTFKTTATSGGLSGLTLNVQILSILLAFVVASVEAPVSSFRTMMPASPLSSTIQHGRRS